jgi:branched-chain amino acid transport system substrate-binding protein
VSEDGTKRILAETSYEVTDPTVDSQLVTLKTSGADTFFLHANPKFVAQAIRKSYDLNWRPHIILASVGSSVATALEPAGLEKSIGTVTAAYLKDPTDKTWADDRAYLDWLAFMKQWYPNGSLIDASNVYGYSMAQTVVQVLRQCADELTTTTSCGRRPICKRSGCLCCCPVSKSTRAPPTTFRSSRCRWLGSTAKLGP